VPVAVESTVEPGENVAQAEANVLLEEAEANVLRLLLLLMLEAEETDPSRSRRLYK
jgi:hypothetical protein